ncbi:MAG: phage/plasmid primase, P4 family [Bacteroidales bacterium]|nr:phage/plasmid primase, P4 family [Bacteroidales bacterium]
MYELIPDELKALPRWVCWRAVPKETKDGLTKISKEPVNPRTGGMARSNDPSTWTDFDTAVSASVDYAGIGFMFHDSGYIGIDIDDRPSELSDYRSGKTDNLFGEMNNALCTYMEYSQSGNGVHLIGRGTLPDKDFKNSDMGVEMYTGARFFVMTGNVCSEFVDIADITESVRPFYERYRTKNKQQNSQPQEQLPLGSCSMSAQAVLDRIQNSRQSQKFSALYAGDTSEYQSRSEADMALCNILAFWCQGDMQLMDEMFRSSGLMRDKWDRKQSGTTYGAITLQKAVEGLTTVYTGHDDSEYSVVIKKTMQNVAPRVQGKMYSFDDTGNANRLFDAFGDMLRFCYNDKKWLYYHEGKWYTDNIGYVRQLADSATLMQEQERVLYAQDENILKAFDRHLKKSRSFAGKTAMIREAEHYAPILPQNLDRNKSVIGVKNGIVDLKTGELLPHDREAYLTKQCPIVYDPDAPTPKLWLQFLNDIFGGDPYMLEYIQKCVGYSLSGSTSEQCAFFLFGTGRNGKSTFLEIVRGILGDYATNIQPQTIMVNPKSGNAPSSDIARLKGARLVTSVEPNEGMRLDEGLLKQLTGDDVVTARKMFAEEFEFKPEFKLWMATNHKPLIRGTDTGIWRRIHLIPFEVQIPSDKVDKKLKYKLAKEADSILKWAVQGCLKWQNDGLRMPQKVLNAVREYQHEMDVVSAFLDACCVTGEGETKASKLYAVYASWADENNEYKMSSTKFGTELMRKDFIGRKIGRDGCRYYTGVALGAAEYKE